MKKKIIQQNLATCFACLIEIRLIDRKINVHNYACIHYQICGALCIAYYITYCVRAGHCKFVVSHYLIFFFLVFHFFSFFSCLFKATTIQKLSQCTKFILYNLCFFLSLNLHLHKFNTEIVPNPIMLLRIFFFILFRRYSCFLFLFFHINKQF